jgi:hypothetical protein
MTNALSVTDGTTTLALSASGCVLTKYMPKTAEFDAATQGYKDVTEPVEFLIVDASIALVQAKLAAIELLLQGARRAQNGLAPRVYLLFQAGSDATALRAEIVDYRLELGEDAAVGLHQQRLECTLIVVRRFCWEWPESEIELSTSNQAAATGGRTIYNHDDGGAGHDNWVQIASSQVTGAMPAACRVQIQNGIGAARTFTKIFLGLNALSDPANFTHILEGESRLSGGTIVNDGTAYSNGQALYIVVGSGVTPTTATFVWTLAAGLLQRAAGRPFRMLARFVGGLGSTTITPEVRAANGASVLWRGDPVSLPALYGGITDLGVVPLPPGGYSANYGSLTLALTFTGVAQRYLDFLQLTPMDAFALLECMAPCANGESVVYDGIERRHYVLSGSNQLSYVAAGGGEILLLPGVTQRLILLEENGTGTNRGEIGDAFTVRVWLRARRLTV